MADELWDRIGDARQARSNRSYWINEVLRLAMPWRQRIDGPNPKERKDDDPSMVRFDSILEQVTSDFASEMMQTFTPRNAPWLNFAATKSVDGRFGNKLNEALTQFADNAFSSIAQSRFYSQAQECYHDLSAGTCGMLIYDELPPVGRICLHVPLAQLLIDVGPFGMLDLRAREVDMKLRDFKATYPQAKIPRTMSASKDSDIVKVVDAYYRNWKNRGDEEWLRCVYINRMKAWEKNYVGAGSCAMQVARWRVDGESPWGVGPGWTAAPPTRTLQEVQALVVAHLQRKLDPAFTYDDDGFLNFDDGIDAGMAYPRAPGSKVDIIESGGDMNIAWMEREEMRQEVRRTHFQDQPHQAGKTPPTLGQWLDQRQNTNTRREGPANLFSEEWTAPIVQRFMWMDAQLGKQPQINVGNQSLTVKPLTPVVKERDMEAVRITEMLFGLTLPLVPKDGPSPYNLTETIQRLKATMGEKHAVMTDPEEAMQMAQAAMEAPTQ